MEILLFRLRYLVLEEVAVFDEFTPVFASDELLAMWQFRSAQFERKSYGEGFK